MLIFLSNPLIFARIYWEGVIRAIFDPASTEFVRFFDLYPKDGGLLDTAVDNGIIKTLEALFPNRPLAWSTVVLLVVHVMYLSGACITLFKAPMRDPAVFIVLVIMGYYLALPGGPSAWGRYRHPAMPIMSVLAGYGLCAAWSEVIRPAFRKSCAHVFEVQAVQEFGHSRVGMLDKKPDGNAGF